MIYNVVLNSNNTSGGTSQANCEYLFDFSCFEDGEYELTFNFSATTSAVNKVLLIHLDGIGSSMNTFTTINTATSQRFGTLIGTVNPLKNGTGDYTYQCAGTLNPPVYLSSKPKATSFTVNIKDVDFGLTNIGVDYVLILSFKKI
jgi:hypothetical protein